MFPHRCRCKTEPSEPSYEPGRPTNKTSEREDVWIKETLVVIRHDLIGAKNNEWNRLVPSYTYLVRPSSNANMQSLWPSTIALADDRWYLFDRVTASILVMRSPEIHVSVLRHCNAMLLAHCYIHHRKFFKDFYGFWRCYVWVSSMAKLVKVVSTPGDKIRKAV